MTVLLVDAHDDTRTMYGDYLRTRGFTCITADTVERASVWTHQADVVITEACVQGAVDGLDFVRRLRHDEASRQLPIIVLTDSATDAIRQGAIDAGCDAFLSKPCVPFRLVDKILQLRSSGKSGRGRPNVLPFGVQMRSSVPHPADGDVIVDVRSALVRMYIQNDDTTAEQYRFFTREAAISCALPIAKARGVCVWITDNALDFGAVEDFRSRPH